MKGDMLEYYEKRPGFGITGINATYYTILHRNLLSA